MNIIEKAVSMKAKVLSKDSTEDISLVEKVANQYESEKNSTVVEKSLDSDSVNQIQTHGSTKKSEQKRRAINFSNLKQHGIITPSDKRNVITEEFRVIKRQLLTNSFNKTKKIKNNNLIMVTSSLAGEGKSFCAVNLAMSIAMEMDHTVLLIDADVSAPMIPKILGMDETKEDKGLLDLLLDDKLSMRDVLIKTNIEKLSILPAGRKSDNANELLASQSMGILLNELVQRYDDRVIIFDSPPLLLTSEARVLASQMGQIVLVVEAEKTTQQVVLETLRQIDSCEVVNLIYNKTTSAFFDNDLYVDNKI